MKNLFLKRICGAESTCVGSDHILQVLGINFCIESSVSQRVGYEKHVHLKLPYVLLKLSNNHSNSSELRPTKELFSFLV